MRAKKEKVTRAEAELAFIRATRYDETIGLASGLQRYELYEFILRVAASWTARVYAPKEKVAKHLEEFIDKFMKPFFDTSIIRSQRQDIRDSPYLNQFFYDNMATL